MIRILLLYISVAFSFQALAQSTNALPSRNGPLIKQMASIERDPKISADSAWMLLSSWNHYPEIKATNRYYLFLYKDSLFGTVPLKVFIPANYRNDVQSPAILMLHGATGGSSFKDAYKDKKDEEDLFHNYFGSRNFILIRPFADGYNANANGTINFDWVVNRFNNNKVTGRRSRIQTNPTFQTLIAIISQLKQVLNIDDNKVLAFGHSDGADGVFALDIYKPSAFAGFIAYNSMLTNLNAYDIYLRNTANRPLYL